MSNKKTQTTIEQLKERMKSLGVSEGNLEKFQDEIKDANHNIESIKQDISDKEQWFKNNDELLVFGYLRHQCHELNIFIPNVILVTISDFDDETLEEEFNPTKLNKLLTELCWMEDTRLIEYIFQIINRFINDTFEQLNFNNIMQQFESYFYDSLNDEQEQKYIKLAFEVMYCSGFIKRRLDCGFCDYKCYLIFESDEIWKLESVQDLITKYQTYVKDKQKRIQTLKTIDANTQSKYWKHIFDNESHGKKVRDKTIKLLNKICVGIIDNANNLNHRSRCLNYTVLKRKFECEIPILLLQIYGFQQQENLFEKQIRLVYRHTDIKPMQELYDKIEYEEISTNQSALVSLNDIPMDQQIKALWYHCLSDVHGKEVQITTINILKNICNDIINKPSDVNKRNLDVGLLRNKFHCNVPLELLIQNGFRKSDDGLRLIYETCDITSIQTMLNILEKSKYIDLSNVQELVTLLMGEQ